MKVDLFDFDLPADRIATHPAEPRDAARLLVVGEALQDRRVRDLPSLLRRGDLLVVNDTRVIPARLTGESGGGRVEITLVREREPGLWIALARPARRLKPGVRVVFASDFAAEAMGRGGAGEVLLRFPVTGPAFQELLARHGAVPLPPYIKRPAGVEARDAEDYQTLFAREPGAIAAPTAGLHFTSELLERLRAAGVGQAAVTLHVGPGTFLPVRVDDTDDHRMHAEWGTVTAGSARAIADTRAAGGRVVAVGTTSLRLLETAAAAGGGVVAPFAGTCDLFIVPGYRFRAVDLLMTNFHLPRSTLFMLVAAFAGLERMKAAYEHAKRAGYRFYSYGDATLLEPPSGR